LKNLTPKSKAKAKLGPEGTWHSTQPEEAHEPRGPRGRPRSSSAQPSSKRESGFEEPERVRARTRSPSRSHGVQIDNTTSKSYWKGKNIAYLKTQLELHGVRFEHWQFTGAQKPVIDPATGKQKIDPVSGEKVFVKPDKEEKMTKTKLLEMIYKKLGI
jgi:hypothetical protein